MATAASLSTVSSAVAIGKRFVLFSPSPSFMSRCLATPSHLRAVAPRARRAAATSASSSIVATIAVGDKLPDTTLSYFQPADKELKTATTGELKVGKKAILFMVPSAFTPKAMELHAKGVGIMACVSVNGAFVTRVWKESLGLSYEVLMLSNSNLELTRTLDVEMDLSDKPMGLSVRSCRYTLLADNGVMSCLVKK